MSINSAWIYERVNSYKFELFLIKWKPVVTPAPCQFDNLFVNEVSNWTVWNLNQITLTIIMKKRYFWQNKSLLMPVLIN